jgi:3',5'-cyclic AMP phosphodiesterase CpdA
MPIVVQLSDLHMLGGRFAATSRATAQSLLFDELVRTLEREREREQRDGQREPFVLVVTGDVFDSSTLPVRQAVDGFLSLHRRIAAVLGGDVPTIVVPGNHDRRRLGMIAPQQGKLFRALQDASDPRKLFIGGCAPPFLAQVVPEGFHRLPFHVVAYDSTFLPGGLVGAGGTLRPEDLLMVSAQLPRDGRPLLVLTHHHLIPTPLTDVSQIDSAGARRAARWVVDSVLPALVSYGDREEITMTALGAGTVLSTLHTLGRAVILLHGHKHVPTARLVTGMSDTCGDVLIASAGSAGTRERVHATRHPDAARLWPSFNLLRVSSEEVRVESIAFSPKARTKRPPLRRQLASARVAGVKWERQPVSFVVKDEGARVEVDEATYWLARSEGPLDAWDYACERRVELRPGARLRRYVDFVHAMPIHIAQRSLVRENRLIELKVGGTTRYEQKRALCRSLGTGETAHGPGTAFEWLGLLVRYGASRAVLRLARKGAAGIEPFGSVTDLTIGRERPVAVHEDRDFWTLTADGCAPRSLLRLYWPLFD